MSGGAWAIEIFNPTCKDIPLAEFELRWLGDNSQWGDDGGPYTAISLAQPSASLEVLRAQEAHVVCNMHAEWVELESTNQPQSMIPHMTSTSDDLNLTDSRCHSTGWVSNLDEGRTAVGLVYQMQIVDVVGHAGPRPQSPTRLGNMLYHFICKYIFRGPHL